MGSCQLLVGCRHRCVHRWQHAADRGVPRHVYCWQFRREYAADRFVPRNVHRGEHPRQLPASWFISGVAHVQCFVRWEYQADRRDAVGGLERRELRSQRQTDRRVSFIRHLQRCVRSQRRTTGQLPGIHPGVQLQLQSTHRAGGELPRRTRRRSDVQCECCSDWSLHDVPSFLRFVQCEARANRSVLRIA